MMSRTSAKAARFSESVIREMTRLAAAHSAAELAVIRDLCVERDLAAFTDEIYEHILYDGAEHVPLARLEGMVDHTCTFYAARRDLPLGALGRTGPQPAADRLKAVTGW